MNSYRILIFALLPISGLLCSLAAQEQSFTFRTVATQPLSGDLFYPHEGNYEKVSISSTRISPDYEFDGPPPIRFYREMEPAGEAGDEPLYEQVLSVAVPRMAPRQFVVFAAKPDGETLAYAFPQQPDFDYGTFQLVNLSSSPFALSLADERFVLDSGATKVLTAEADVSYRVGNVIYDGTPGGRKLEGSAGRNESAYARISVNIPGEGWVKPVKMRWTVERDLRSLVLLYLDARGRIRAQVLKDRRSGTN